MHLCLVLILEKGFQLLSVEYDVNLTLLSVLS